MDYLPTAITGIDTQESINDAWKCIYGITKPPKIWCGLNLQWPKFDLPLNQGTYIISWHTEYIDLEWLDQQSSRVFPDKIICITDYPCDISVYGKDNVECRVFDTLDRQIQILTQYHGLQSRISKPEYKFSSLSMRFTQYKKFITAYLLANVPHDEMMLTWHRWIAKQDDLHDHPPNIRCLEELDYTLLSVKQLINWVDDSDNVNINPVHNGRWQVPAYINCLINLTNESMHYSQTIRKSVSYIMPGPYLTEKTMKPLVSGRPFISVGQSRSCERLSRCGFSFNFGFDHEYDTDDGDLTRIDKIYSLIRQIKNQSIDVLFDASLDACQSNLHWIANGDFTRHMVDINAESLYYLKNM